jgi:hypothetical protein
LQRRGKREVDQVVGVVAAREGGHADVEVIAASKVQLRLASPKLGEIAATDKRPLRPGERGAFALRPERL